MKRLGAAPCQWSSPGSKYTRSPGRMTSIGPAAALAEADAFGDVDGLAAGVGVPRGSGAGREMDTSSRAGRRRSTSEKPPKATDQA
jgi:hypothetical protein